MKIMYEITVFRICSILTVIILKDDENKKKGRKVLTGMKNFSCYVFFISTRYDECPGASDALSDVVFVSSSLSHFFLNF